MKAVLMSLKPEWSRLIAAGEKTVEVRKSKPKLSTPFKVYIYCTKDGGTYGYHKSFVKPKNANQYKGFCTGTVIGEFVCDRTEEWDSEYWNDNSVYQAISRIDYDNEGDYEWVNVSSNEDDNPSDNYLCKESCLSFEEIQRYAGNGRFYAWRILDLVIYDKPKALEEFCILDKEKQKQCAYRERYYVNPDLSNGAALKAGFTCNLGHEIDFCRPFENKRCICLKPISRPPQSWCYVTI